MEYSHLGNQKNKISRLGFGCWAIGGHGYGAVNDHDSIEAIRSALDHGVNFFDTADVYGFGRSETVLSKGLAEQRHDVLIATKFGVAWDDQGKTYYNSDPKYIQKALESSLCRLRIESIPIYQMHWPDPKIPIEDVMECLLKLKDQGKIQHIGCTNFNNSEIIKAQNKGRVETVQLSYSLIARDQEEYLRSYHNNMKMTTVVYGVLGRGLLSGKYNANSSFGESDTRQNDPDFIERIEKNLEYVRSLQKIATYYNSKPGQIALQWVLNKEFIDTAIVGMKTKLQVSENCAALDIKVDWKSLYGIKQTKNY